MPQAGRRSSTPGCWCPSGEAWVVGLGDRRTTLKDSKGLRHIAHLLGRPGEEVGALALVLVGEGLVGVRGAAPAAEEGLAARSGEDAGAPLDEQAKAAYRSRLADLREEADEAERYNDPERAARAQAELDFLARELGSAVGLGGRDRRTGADAERARVNVTRAIKTAVDRIAEHDEPLAAHLRSGLRTGTFCGYEPPANDPVAWEFDVAGAPATALTSPQIAATAWTIARPAVALLERDGELEALGTELDAAEAGSGRVVVVDGPPGIGKSAFLGEVERRASARGFAVLTAVGRELEQPFAFGIVRRLFDAVLAGTDPAARDQLLAGAVAPAGAMLGFSPAGSPEPGRSFPVLNGLYWLTAALARAQPLLVVVDDLQWSDEESLAWLAYMSSRLDTLPVTILIGTRPVADVPDAARGELLDGRVATLLHLRPLSGAAVAEIVRRRLPDADDVFVAACATASGGNPFFLLELLAAARAAGLPPDASGAARLRTMNPAGVQQLVLSRLRALSADASGLAAACAVLAPVDVATAASVADLDPDAGLAAADELIGAGIVLDEPRLDFVHPLVRAATERTLGLESRTLLHERAAALLRNRGAPSLAVATHLRHARPSGDAATVSILREAARAAAAHGSTGPATELLERALAEPPPAAEMPAVLLDLARAYAGAGEATRAVGAAERGIELAGDDARTRAQLVDELCRHERFDVGRRVALLDAEIERVAPVDRGLRFTLEARALQLLYYDTIGQGSAESSARHDERLRRLAGQGLGDGPSERLLLSMLASQQALNYALPAEEAAAMAERALDDGVLTERLAAGDDACDTAIEALLAADHLDSADRHARATERLARSRGAVLAAGYACMLRAFGALRRGALLEVEALLPSVFDVAGAIGGAYVPYVAQGLRGMSAIETGEFDVAADAADALDAIDFAPHSAPAVRGIALAARGEHELAVEELRTAVRLQRAAGRRMSLAYGALGPELAMSLAAVGSRDEAEALARDELAAARVFGAPSALGGALRALGLVLAGEARMEALQEAVDVLDGSPALLHRAKALHALGSARLLTGDALSARPALAGAARMAERCAAHRLAEAATAELELAGGAVEVAAPSARERLTPGERRVAELTAEGATPLEIAQALLSTLPAVTAQLASIRAKLGVDEAQALAGVLAG